MFWAFVWNMGNCRSDVKGETQVGIHKCESTDAGHRDGIIRSSVEAFVMKVERRGDLIRFWPLSQLEKGGAING
jgi:hypothetical protein